MMSISNSIMVQWPHAIMSYSPFIDENINHNFYDVMSLNQLILTRTVSTVFTMLSTRMSFPRFNIVYNIEIFHQELLPLVYEMLALFAMLTL